MSITTLYAFSVLWRYSLLISSFPLLRYHFPFAIVFLFFVMFRLMTHVLFFRIDPAVSALLADFTPTQCLVTNASVAVGMSKCQWTSCAEGCTRDLFKCFQIRVAYM